MTDSINMRSSLIVVYKMLKYLDIALGDEELDEAKFSSDAFNISDTRWRKLLEMLQDAEYIKGVKIKKRDFISGENDTEIEIGNIQITLKGLQYLVDNSAFVKIGRILDKSLKVASIAK